MNCFEVLEGIKLPPYELALVVVVLVGVKPASTITFGNCLDDEDTYLVEEKFKRMGLLTKVVIREDFPRFHEIHIAKSLESLERLLGAQDNYSWGLAYGYPVSAVEAAREKDFLSEDEYPDTSDFIICFTMSRLHWREEIEVMRKWTDCVREYMPKIYEDFLALEIG